MTEHEGVPGARCEALRRLAIEASPDRLDRVWIFPPIMRGRTESGVIAAGCFSEGDRRILVTLAYRAEEAGKGVTFEHQFHEIGVAPTDRLPKIMDGVVKRSDVGLGAPRSIVIEGNLEVFEELVDEMAPPDSPLPGARSSGFRKAGTARERSTP